MQLFLTAAIPLILSVPVQMAIGINKIEVIALAALAGSLINLPISCYLTYHIGVAGVIWGTVLTTFFSNLLVPGLYVFHVLEINPAHLPEANPQPAVDRRRGTYPGDLAAPAGHAGHLSGHRSLYPRRFRFFCT